MLMTFLSFFIGLAGAACLAYFTCSRAYYWRFNLPAVVIFNREINVCQRN